MTEFTQLTAAPTLEGLQRQLQEVLTISDTCARKITASGISGSGQYYGAYGTSGMFAEMRAARLKAEITALLAEQRLACEAELSMFDDGELPSPI